MGVENFTDYFNEFASGLSFSSAQNTLEPLVFFVIGVIVYSIFVFKFYRFISRRDIFRISSGKSHTTIRKIAYILEYIFLFPVISFFWFLVMASLLSMISEVLVIKNISMISMVIIISIRVAAYYNEDLSVEIAKLVPFALLAIILADITTFSYETPLKTLMKIPDFAHTLTYYFIFFVVLEFVLRAIRYTKLRLSKKK
ncbi:MAG: hypothetical protein V1900_02050 [Candidatus Aenigmatarchaeota archaeon]